jgi:hypothetical protein
MKEYHKIETLFERDMEGNKKLIEGKFRNKSIEFLKDNQWHFTEKIDGTNIRIHWDGHKVFFGGRTDNAQIPTNLMYALNDKFLGNINEELFEQKFGATSITLYGEGYGEKIQKGGGNYREGVGFILFDVNINGTWLERENVEDIAKVFNVPVVPIILTGTIQDAVDYVKTKPKSTISIKEHESEGLVGKPVTEMQDRFGARIITKIKVCDFTNTTN